jgi:hypothetical protein
MDFLETYKYNDQYRSILNVRALAVDIFVAASLTIGVCFLAACVFRLGEAIRNSVPVAVPPVPPKNAVGGEPKGVKDEKRSNRGTQY